VKRSPTSAQAGIPGADDDLPGCGVGADYLIAPLAGAAAGILLGFASTRRSERALLSIFEFNWMRVILMIVIEQAKLVRVTHIAIVAALAAAWTWLGLDRAFSARMLLTQITMAVGVTLLLIATIAWVSTLGDPSGTVRDPG
jgi:hypothetical protein